MNIYFLLTCFTSCVFLADLLTNRSLSSATNTDWLTICYTIFVNTVKILLQVLKMAIIYWKIYHIDCNDNYEITVRALYKDSACNNVIYQMITNICVSTLFVRNNKVFYQLTTLDASSTFKINQATRYAIQRFCATAIRNYVHTT